MPVVAWAALIFALSSVPDLGTGLGGWDVALRKAAHVGEYAVLGALLVRASGMPRLAAALGVLYALSDEIHQSFVAGRQGSPVDFSIDTAGVVCGVVLWQVVRRSRGPASRPRAVAIDLDRALGDTRRLWDDWLASVSGLLGIDASALPADRAAAAGELDRCGAGNWRTLLERFGEERAPLYLRRDAEASAALRALDASGFEIGVFTDAPEPLARIALAQLGAERRVTALETGAGALERLLDHLGDGAVVVRTHDELVRAST